MNNEDEKELRDFIDNMITEITKRDDRPIAKLFYNFNKISRLMQGIMDKALNNDLKDDTILTLSNCYAQFIKIITDTIKESEE